ncbi:flagellar assembly protein FliW [Paenibacillus thailandensis]|uniref:Flagellar assembly factor FliW n=1 Tax=Paenibacillus thailandensis TaxID=393250 RepID=A0ABW5R3F4_9BACL
MIVNTTHFGPLDLTDRTVVTFSSGIPGFKEYKSYTVVEVEDSPFLYLQSVELGELVFVAVSPFDFFPDYEFDLTDAVIHELEIKEQSDVIVYNIVTVRGALEEATVNLAAPIIINKRTLQAVQFILQDNRYNIRQRLFPGDTNEKPSDRS